MRFDIVTLFPEMIEEAARHGVTGRAIDKGLVEIKLWNPRQFTNDVHRTVDDRPFGGGPGMVMKFEPLQDTIQAIRADSNEPIRVIYLSPQGRLITQEAMIRFSALPRIAMVAGRYEGLDERLIEAEIDEEWSIGDYVLSGGELAALVVFDAVARLLPGVLGHAESARQDSHMTGLLDFPHYTRPDVVDGRAVPEILQSGNHAAIARWRLKQSLGRTWLRRPDLLAKLALDQIRRELLEEFQQEYLSESN